MSCMIRSWSIRKRLSGRDWEDVINMYIKEIIDHNVGPIEHVDICPFIDENGIPKPLIFVGENGSGKSTLVSNIVDSFFEIAGKAYQNVVHNNRTGNGYSYFKIISGLQIKIGSRYLISRISYNNGSDYIFKSGKCDIETIKGDIHYTGDISQLKDDENGKCMLGINEKQIEKEFATNVICYFGPERYEKPVWMGQSYYEDINTHLSVDPIFNGNLKNPIIATDIGKENFRWLLDVIVDSRTDIENHEGQLQSAHVEIGNLVAMKQARDNVEMIMSSIIGEEVYFGLNLRKEGGARFNIKRKVDDSIVAPTMDSLSTGQLALFNMFTTIVRYADNNDINMSIHPENIAGIVVIDEIELHLHSVLQKEVLPRLIKLFPKVQFIITTHSPLFLIGMKQIYGEGNFDIYNLPQGIKIDVERFSEFERAYSYFAETEFHNNKIMEAINKSTGKALVITEGATDWKHMKAACYALKRDEKCSDLLEEPNFEFFQYEPANSKEESEFMIEMGNKALCAMCEAYSKIPQKRKLIFVADRDDKETNKKLCGDGEFKDWGNNVYSLVLPIPTHRLETPNICIEHYYSDAEIKTLHTEDEIGRRLFLGNEFDDRGIASEIGMFCAKRK